MTAALSRACTGAMPQANRGLLKLYPRDYPSRVVRHSRCRPAHSERKASHQTTDLRQPVRERTQAVTGPDALPELLRMTARDRGGHTEFVCDVAPARTRLCRGLSWSTPTRGTHLHFVAPDARCKVSDGCRRSLFGNPPLLHGELRPLAIPSRTHITRVASTRVRAQSCYRPRPPTRSRQVSISRPSAIHRTPGGHHT